MKSDEVVTLINLNQAEKRFHRHLETISFYAGMGEPPAQLQKRYQSD